MYWWGPCWPAAPLTVFTVVGEGSILSVIRDQSSLRLKHQASVAGLGRHEGPVLSALVDAGLARLQRVCIRYVPSLHHQFFFVFGQSGAD